MSNVDITFKNAYRMSFELREQQEGSALQDYIVRENVDAEFKYFDYMDSIDPTEVFTRNADTTNEDVTYDRRRINLRRFTLAPLVDEYDQLAQVVDPKSTIVTDSVFGMGRQKDKLLVDAAYGSVWGGYDGTTEYTYNASNTIAVDYQEGGGGSASGLTVDKLLEMGRIFKSYNVSGDIPLYCAITAKQEADLLNDTNVSSNDYNIKKVLVDGRLDYFAGFKFVQLNGQLHSSDILPVTTDGNDYRRVLCWAEDGLMLGVGKEIMTDIQQRIDKNYSYQIYTKMWMNAMRTSEKKVGSILCSEA